MREVHAKLTRRIRSFAPASNARMTSSRMVMNQTKPRYTTTGLGWAVEAADLDTDQVRAELSVRVFEAM